LASLADINAKLGNTKVAETNIAEARKIIEQIAESLHEVGLAESFLNQPQVQKMMRA
jgi:predicted metal-dependent hydrolase